ncbi:MAG: rhodanese-like domain-containing protein [Tatlockia sp.]|nr:rhodanese-like domain-containing protein [Tatlockia sp.]
MGQLSQFILNHWVLWALLILILILIYINELLTQKKRAKELSPQAAVNLINHDNAVVIDLRDAESYAKGHIIDAIRASAEDFNQKRMAKYKEKPIILVCAKGLQTAVLATKLKQEGFGQAMVLAGGMTAWRAAELPIVKGK